MATRRGLDFALSETWEIELECVDPDGDPLDLTGGGVEFRLATASALLLDLRVEATGDNLVTGKATLLIAPVDQAPIPAGLYYYETRAYQPSGVVHQQLYGTLDARPSLFRQFDYTGPALSEPGQLNFSAATQSALIGH